MIGIISSCRKALSRFCLGMLIGGGVAAAEEPSDFAFSEENVILLSRIQTKPGLRDEAVDIVRAFYEQVREHEPGCLLNVMHVPANPPAPADAQAEDAQATTLEPPADQTGLPFSIVSPDADSLVFYEVYEDTAAANAHTSTPHFAVFSREIRPLLAEPIALEFVRAKGSTR